MKPTLQGLAGGTSGRFAHVDQLNQPPDATMTVAHLLMEGTTA
jgi:hypothetical protein